MGRGLHRKAVHVCHVPVPGNVRQRRRPPVGRKDHRGSRPRHAVQRVPGVGLTSGRYANRGNWKMPFARTWRTSAMAKRKPTDYRSRILPAVVPEQIDRSIIVIRGQKVLLDAQLAGFYGVETRELVQAVKRNLDRFPDDFMFQPTGDEWAVLRPATAATQAEAGLRSQTVILKPGRGQHRKYPLPDSHYPRNPREILSCPTKAAQNPAHFQAIPPRSTRTWPRSSWHGRTCPRRPGRVCWQWSGWRQSTPKSSRHVPNAEKSHGRATFSPAPRPPVAGGLTFEFLGSCAQPVAAGRMPMNGLPN